eukprot:SAG31_NODE_6705_length_1916_cov_1.838834_1_plen_326_part_00
MLEDISTKPTWTFQEVRQMTASYLQVDPAGHHAKMVLRMGQAERNIGALQEAVSKRDSALELKDQVIKHQLKELDEMKQKFRITCRDGVAEKRRADALHKEMEDLKANMRRVKNAVAGVSTALMKGNEIDKIRCVNCGVDDCHETNTETGVDARPPRLPWHDRVKMNLPDAHNESTDQEINHHHVMAPPSSQLYILPCGHFLCKRCNLRSTDAKRSYWTTGTDEQKVALYQSLFDKDAHYDNTQPIKMKCPHCRGEYITKADVSIVNRFRGKEPTRESFNPPTRMMKVNYNKRVIRKYKDSGQRYAVVLGQAFAKVGDVSALIGN